MNTKDLSEKSISDCSNAELFLKYKENKEIEIRNELIHRYLYIADILVKKYVNKGIEYDDLYQVASLGLIQAVERFNVDKGFEFGSFATPTILGEIKRYFRDKGWAIRVPRRTQEISQKLQSAREKLSQELHRAPKVAELAEYLDASEDEILQAMEASTVFEIQSLNQTYNNDGNDRDLKLEEALGIGDNNFRKLENQDLIKKVLQLMPPVEKEIFTQRFIQEKTQGEIAKKLQVSQMTISRMEKKIINRFKDEMIKSQS